MRLGIKTFGERKPIDLFRKKADFFEIMALDDVDYSFLEEFDTEIVVHAQHQGFGVNLADKTKRGMNLTAIKIAIKLADIFNSKKIILHLGTLENENCSIENSQTFLKEIAESRILIENLPFRNENSSEYLFSTPKEMRSFLAKTKCGFCFDINHAIRSALEHGKPPYSYIKDFIKLNPAHFHIGGQKLSGEDHISFLDSDIDLGKILSLLPRDAEITLEVTTDLKKIEYDLKFIGKIIGELGLEN
jgi:sugar phosphate isomerase/epimerase